MQRSKQPGLWLAGAALVLVCARGESAPQAPQAPAPAPAAPAIQEVERIRLTNTPHELEVFPAFSPKDDLLAYSSDRNGPHEIYIRKMDGTGEERQLTRDGMHNVQADWSPDGKWIAYHSVRADGIWVIPSDGGKPRQVAKFGSDPAFSPDGRTIAFQSEPLEALSLYTYNGMPPTTLWLVSADGGEPKQLTRWGAPHGGHGAPSWSADGKRITFTSSDIEPSACELWSIAADGTDLKRISSSTMPRDPVFSPDARDIFYSSPDPNRGYRWGVWKASVAGDKPTELSTLPARHITTTHDGCRAVVSEMGMAGNLWTIPVDPKTGEATGPAVPFTNDPDDRSSQPVFSPDRSRIAFHRVVDGNRFQIWLSDPEGKERKFLTREATFGSGPPVWLPDGKHLVFNSRPDGTMLLKKIDVETGVVEPYRQLDPKWSWVRLSPEGQRVAFARADEKSIANIWMLPSLDAKEPRQLTFDKETADFPMWSPDGKWLAFRLRRGSDTQIGIVSADGGEVKQLTSGPGENWLPSWSPDSNRIAFAGLRNGIWNIYWVDRNGGPIHKVTSQPDKMTIWVRYPVWYPAGDRIIFEYSETLGDLWQLNLCPGASPAKTK